MFEAIDIVIAAFISVGGIVLTQWFNYRERKDDSKERFFYEIYQRRLALYEEVIKTLTDMGKPGDYLLKMTLRELNNKLIGDSHTLLALTSRLWIYGSPEARGILNLPMAAIRDILRNNVLVQSVTAAEAEVVGLSVNSMLLTEAVNSLVLLIGKSLAEFAECVGKETGADFVNKKIVEFLCEVPVKKRMAKPKKRNPRKPDKGIGDQR